MKKPSEVFDMRGAFYECIARENEMLKKALRLAIGELSTYGEHTGKCPVKMYEDALRQAKECKND
jgi:hypothetical protein